MLLAPDDAALFHRLYPALIGFVAGRLDGVEGIVDARTFRSAPNEAKAKARDRMLDNTQLIDAFIEANPEEYREQELSVTTAWKHFRRGSFVVERDLKPYTIFLDDGNPATAYGVLGLSTEIADMLPYGMPMPVKAVLLPWKQHIICDGLIHYHNIIMGGGLKRMYRDTYREAKARGIITSLDPDRASEPTGPARAPKTSAIARFLKRCPDTVAEFKQKYGEPRMEMREGEAREYSVWNLDGTPALDIDHVMVYANIIRHQVLYVHAKQGKITHIAVVNPTEWKRGDFKPHAGNHLLR